MKFRFCAAFVFVLAALLAVAGFAKQPADTTKYVHGFVLGRNDVPLSSATVFLQSSRTKAIKSFTSDKDGAFRFPGLPPGMDYDLWAEYNGVKSDVKFMSSMDTRPDIEVKLHIDVEKK